MTSDSWTDQPLGVVLRQWTSKNTGLPEFTINFAFLFGTFILLCCIIRLLMRFVSFTIRKVLRLVMIFKWPVILLAILFAFLSIPTSKS